MFKVDLLLRDRLNLVAPASYRGLGESFPVEHLHEVPLVIPSLPNSLRVLLDSLMARRSKALNVSMECDASVGIVKQLVLEGCGCTILPMSPVHDDVALGVLQAVPLVRPEVFRDVAIVTSRNRPPILDQRRVIQSMRKVILSLVADGRWVDAVLMR